MSDKELNELIGWCRTKLANEKKKPFGCRLNSKALDGYEQAIKAVMSYLHSKKKESNNGSI